MRTAFLCVMIALMSLPLSASAQTRMTATQHYERGAQLFGRDQFAEAAREFQLAYDMSRNLGLLYNLARAQERANDIDGALESYRRYRDAGCPQGSRVEVEAAIAALELRQRERLPHLPTHVETTPPQPVIVPPTGPEHPLVPQIPTTVAVRQPPIRQPIPEEMSPVHRYGPWIAMGTGVALGIGALAQGLITLGDHNMVSESANGTRPFTSEVEQAQSRLNDESTRTTILAATGGAVFVSGVLWMVLRPHPHANEAPPRIQPLVGWNTLGVTGTF